MNDNEKIQKAEQLIAEANTLLSEVKAIHNNEEDVIAKYKNDYCKDKQYYFNINGGVDYFIPTELDTFEEQSNPYSNYLTEELAKQAKNLKDFNDKLLAFKYCYDLDYKPDWSDNTKNIMFITTFVIANIQLTVYLLFVNHQFILAQKKSHRNVQTGLIH